MTIFFLNVFTNIFTKYIEEINFLAALPALHHGRTGNYNSPLAVSIILFRLKIRAAAQRRNEKFRKKPKNYNKVKQLSEHLKN